MITFLLAVLLEDASGRPAPVPDVPRSTIFRPITIPEGSSEELVACARAWSEALGYGGHIAFGGNPG